MAKPISASGSVPKRWFGDVITPVVVATRMYSRHAKLRARGSAVGENTPPSATHAGTFGSGEGITSSSVMAWVVAATSAVPIRTTTTVGLVLKNCVALSVRPPPLEAKSPARPRTSTTSPTCTATAGVVPWNTNIASEVAGLPSPGARACITKPFDTTAVTMLSVLVSVWPASGETSPAPWIAGIGVEATALLSIVAVAVPVPTVTFAALVAIVTSKVFDPAGRRFGWIVTGTLNEAALAGIVKDWVASAT